MHTTEFNPHTYKTPFPFILRFVHYFTLVFGL